MGEERERRAREERGGRRGERERERERERIRVNQRLNKRREEREGQRQKRPQEEWGGLRHGCRGPRAVSTTPNSDPLLSIRDGTGTDMTSSRFHVYIFSSVLSILLFFFPSSFHTLLHSQFKKQGNAQSG